MTFVPVNINMLILFPLPLFKCIISIFITATSKITTILFKNESLTFALGELSGWVMMNKKQPGSPNVVFS